MNFAMDEDVLELVDSIGDFFDRRGDDQSIAEATLRSTPADWMRWSALCEMGLPVLRLPAPDGIGAGLLEATAVAERIGSVLLPEPAVSTVVLVNAWSGHAGGAELLDAMCTGSRVITFCGFDTVEMSPEGTVSGHAHLPDDGSTESVALLARDTYTADPAIVIVDISDATAVLSRCSTDPTRPTVLVDLQRIEPTEVLRLNASAAEAVRRELALLTTAELVGGMQRVVTSTIEHVKQRDQFGRPIGSFQAVKHRLADMYTRTEQARAAVQFAALELTDGGGESATALASVIRWVPRTAIDVCEDAIHLHGAMGYSWEVNMHLYLRRAMAVRTALSDWAASQQHISRVSEVV